MIKIRKSKERGYNKINWLESFHSFSFGGYYDPEYVSFGPLRVINEDIIAPSGGFAPHSHQDMEIVTYIISGALEHKDSMGNSSVIRPGEIQRMSAGTGITHSEYNHSDKESVHLLQIWFHPDKKNLSPGYEQAEFKRPLIASQTGKNATIKLNQDVDIYSISLNNGEKFELSTNKSRNIWVQMINGNVVILDHELSKGDGGAITKQDHLSINALEPSELLIFDMG